VYGLGWDGVSGRQLFRLRAKDGVFDNWLSRGSAALAVADLWADRADNGQMPDRADGMDVKQGVLYLTFSAADFRPDDVSDLATLTRKMLADATVGPRLLKQVNPRFHERLHNWLAGHMREEDAFCLHSVQGPWWKFELPEGLTRLLDRTDLVPGTDGLGPMSRSLANRRFLEQRFAGHLRPLKTGMLGVCDASSGRLRKLLEVPNLGAVRAVSDRLVYAI